MNAAPGHHRRYRQRQLHAKANSVTGCQKIVTLASIAILGGAGVNFVFQRLQIAVSVHILYTDFGKPIQKNITQVIIGFLLKKMTVFCNPSS